MCEFLGFDEAGIEVADEEIIAFTVSSLTSIITNSRPSSILAQRGLPLVVSRGLSQMHQERCQDGSGRCG